MRDSIRTLFFLSLTLLGGSILARELAPEQLLPAPRRTRIVAERDLTGLAERIAGRGLGIADRILVDGEGREIVWREAQRDTDERGGLHLTYKQYLTAEGLEAELFGSGMMLHYEADGTLAFVDGVQFDQVKIANRVRRSPEEASRRVVAHLRPFAFLDLERRAAVIRPELKLVQLGDEFRFAYFSIAPDGDGVPHRVILDAEDGRLLARVSMQLASNCVAPNVSAVAATGIPVRDDVPTRTGLKATPDPRAPFTHDGAWTYNNVKMTVYQYGVGSAFQCSGKPYTVFPLLTEGNTPVFRTQNVSGELWEGSVAGDALWHTYQTMRTFYGFGRKGWDNRNSPANIVVDYGKDGRTDHAVFNYFGGFKTVVDSGMPEGVLVAPQRFFTSPAAALDAIAHEWGHGVVHTTAGWAYVYVDAYTPSPTAIDELALHEGWSDVIGMIVENRRHEFGSGVEKYGDWTLHEDSGDFSSGAYARGAIDDGAGHRWQSHLVPGATGLFNDKLHKDDRAGVTSDAPHNAHEIGNMLNVVHKLMAVGGSNPVCDDDSDTIPKSSCPAVKALGRSKAGHILFQALQYRVRYWHLWPDLMDPIKQEAFNQYNSCSYDPLGYNANAEIEQRAVIDAFKNIGYPGRNTDIIRCSGT